MDYDVGCEVLERKSSRERYTLKDRMIVIRKFIAGQSWYYMCRKATGEMCYFAEAEILDPNEELVHTFDQETKEWEVG